MATIAPSLSSFLGVWTKVALILEREGVGEAEFKRFNDDLEYRAAVIHAFKPDDVALIEMPEEFDQAAMQRLLRHILGQEWRFLEAVGLEGLLKQWDYNPFEVLATTEKMMELMGGLSHLQRATVVLRSGLIDGVPVSVNETAERLGITTKQLNKLRGDASRIMKQRAWRMGKEKHRAAQASARAAYLQAHANDLLLANLGLSTRLYVVLTRNNLNYLGEVAERSREQLLDLHNMGRASLAELDVVMAKHGLTYRED